METVRPDLESYPTINELNQNPLWRFIGELEGPNLGRVCLASLALPFMWKASTEWAFGALVLMGVFLVVTQYLEEKNYGSSAQRPQEGTLKPGHAEACN